MNDPLSIAPVPHRTSGLSITGQCLATLLMVVLVSCTVGPDFRTPDQQLPGQWTAAPKSGAAALSQWWKQFKDPELSALVNEALTGNIGVQQAAARVRQARATRAGSIARNWPWLNASASTTSSNNGDNGGDTQFQGGFDANWELDLFGGTRRNVEAASAELSAGIHDEEAARLSLAAEVASTYTSLRAYQNQLAIARDNLAAQEKSTAIIRKRADAGFASGLDLANAESQIANTRATIPSLEISVRQTMHALAVLLGQPPANLIARLSKPDPIPSAPTIPAGLPSDLLRRRPDILATEARAHAATARIGVAIAEWFPKFSLRASLSQQSLILNDWLNTSARNTTIGPAVNWALLEGGKLNADVRVQQALRDQAVLAYRQTVLTALQEVEDTLIAITKEDERQQMLEAALAANRNAAKLSLTLYTQGQADFLNVLDTQRSVFQTEEQLAASTRDVTLYRIALCKALGGGW